MKFCLNDHDDEHIVVSLDSEGHHGENLRRNGIRVEDLQVREEGILKGFVKLRAILKSLEPDALHAWMPHAMLLATVAAKTVGITQVFWGVRASDYGSWRSSPGTKAVVLALVPLSRWLPRKILCVGERARDNHISMGFPEKKMVVCDNGFAPAVRDSAEVLRVRTMIRRAKNGTVPIVGMVSRYHPQKDHLTFLRALAEVKSRGQDFIALLGGAGVAEDNNSLSKQIRELGLSQKVVLLGELEQSSSVYSFLTLHVLSSRYGEGFPNVVAESMLEGIPNIVSDVGDSARVVGATGWVVPPGSSDDLARALCEALALETSELAERGRAARERIEQNFSVERMVLAIRSQYVERPVIAFPRYSPLGASSRVRMYQFEDKLQDSGWAVTYHPLISDSMVRTKYQGKSPIFQIFIAYVRRAFVLLMSSPADLKWIEKDAFPWLPFWIEDLFLGRGRIVLDFDDPVDIGYRAHRSRLVRFMLGKKITSLIARSNSTVVGNEELFSTFSSAAESDVWIVPSVVDAEKAQSTVKVVEARDAGFRFGWIGTPITFKRYVLPHLDFFERLAAELKGEFVVVGAGAHLRDTSALRFFEWDLVSEGPLVATFDAGIMPLEDDPWSRGKCGYKILQYFSQGVPAVASAVGANKKIITEGVDGYLVQARGDWKNRLTQLASNRDKARLMGQRGREKVVKSYSTAAVAPILSTVFAESSRDGSLFGSNFAAEGETGF